MRGFLELIAEPESLRNKQQLSSESCGLISIVLKTLHDAQTNMGR